MGTPVLKERLSIYEEEILYRASVSEEFFRKIASSLSYHSAINRKPIGAIELSNLTTLSFQFINGNQWVLLDGSEVTNTDLGQFLINQGLYSGPVFLPDMRGQVPIGINHGRADGKQNTVVPDLGLGQQMGDGIKSHNHPTNAITFGGGASGGTTGRNFPAAYVDYFGQSQNTVNSVGVNWFIKVWNTPPTY